MSGGVGTIGHALASSASITLGADGFVVVGYTEDASSVPTLVCKSDGVATPFGSQVEGQVAPGANQCWVAFVGWLTAGTHTIAVSGGSNSFTDIFLIPVTGLSNGWFDKSHSSFQASPTTTTDALTSGATATLSRQPAFVLGMSVRFTGSSDSAGTGFTLNATTAGTNVTEMVTEKLTGYSSTTGKAATFTAVSNTEHMTVVLVFSETAAGGPTISVQPSSVQVAVGATANFTVTAAASGGGTLSYQWKENGSNVGTNSASYAHASAAQTDNGIVVTCDITETGGSNDGTVTTTNAVLTVGILTVAVGALASSAASGTTVAPAYPALAAGDLLRLVLCQKPSAANGGTATTPGGWTLVAQITGATDGNTGGYTTTLANNTGNVNLYVYETTATGSESGTLSVTVGTNNMCSAFITSYRAPSGYTFASTTSTTGKDTTAGSMSIAGGADPGVTAGDVVTALFGAPTAFPGTATASSEAITQTGVTYGTVAELIQSGSTTNNRDGIVAWEARANSGTSSGVPTWSFTGGGTTTNIRGPGVLLRLRASSSNLSAIPFGGFARAAGGGGAALALIMATSGGTPHPIAGAELTTFAQIAKGESPLARGQAATQAFGVRPAGALPSPPRGGSSAHTYIAAPSGSRAPGSNGTAGAWLTVGAPGAFVLSRGAPGAAAAVSAPQIIAVGGSSGSHGGVTLETFGQAAVGALWRGAGGVTTEALRATASGGYTGARGQVAVQAFGVRPSGGAGVLSRGGPANHSFIAAPAGGYALPFSGAPGSWITVAPAGADPSARGGSQFAAPLSALQIVAVGARALPVGTRAALSFGAQASGRSLYANGGSTAETLYGAAAGGRPVSRGSAGSLSLLVLPFGSRSRAFGGVGVAATIPTLAVIAAGSRPAGLGGKTVEILGAAPAGAGARGVATPSFEALSSLAFGGLPLPCGGAEIAAFGIWASGSQGRAFGGTAVSPGFAVRSVGGSPATRGSSIGAFLGVVATGSLGHAIGSSFLAGDAIFLHVFASGGRAQSAGGRDLALLNVLPGSAELVITLKADGTFSIAPLGAASVDFEPLS